ncbi:hypothetical protein [Sphingomicrobium lutaoense]|uniref:PilZ domain-containing protein n=1 Tax=Sphingomicrobium lutaoense TaxID=515949 RepID=A0A839YVC0_9SPHN|nr:hypothetical protein [Sphingomicrobium lutaoense]MBB3762986.1 hypothetical protein [Sphingomicrobium lutaoense]
MMKQWEKSVEAEKIRRKSRAPRVDLGRLGNLVDGQGNHIPVVVENVSAQGVLMQIDKIIPPDFEYDLICGQERVQLQIVWSNHGFAGAKIV